MTLSLLPSLARADHSDGVWRIAKTSWSATDEKNFSEFVAILGESGCKTAAKCLTHPTNPYVGQNPDSIKNAFSDCADLPYVFRAYFAFMNDLPFSFISDVDAIGSGGNPDIRYSKNGNKATERRVIKAGEKIDKVIKETVNTISSAMFRMPPDADSSGPLAADFYSPAITRQSVRPGSVIYDPNGHVALVYKVETDGRVRFMDGHPDNSVTRGVYGEKFARSRPAAGAGFKNFRPMAISGSSVKAALNSEISDFSLVQFFGTNPSSESWSAGKFKVNGSTVDYYDYVRIQLAGGTLKFNPVTEFENMLDALCQDAKDRVAAVNAAIENNLDEKSHPDRLPENIYGTSGEWESFSSPSRDARLKTSFRELHKKTEQFLSLVAQHSSQIDYGGTVAQLKGELQGVFATSAGECAVTYKKSNGQSATLTLAEIEKRLWKLSFDPYHCTELRWGATGSELASCPDSTTKREWYAAEQRLRNQIERTYDVKMGFSLADLEAKKTGSGVDQAPLVSIESLIQ